MLDNLRFKSGLNKLIEKEEDEGLAITKEQQQELDDLEQRIEKLNRFLCTIEKVYTKCNEVTFKDHVCKELVESLIIKRMQDFSSPTDWLPLAGTQKLNLKTLEVQNHQFWVHLSGSNGKSLLFVTILKKIMGGLAGMLPEDMIMETLNQVHSKNDSWMKGVYAAILDDPKEYSVLDSGKFKNLGNIEGGQYVPVLLLNNYQLTFSEVLDEVTLNRLLVIKLMATFLEAVHYDALNLEEKASGCYIREYPHGTCDDRTFLQGMFNNTMVRGGRLYWATTSSEHSGPVDRSLFNVE